MSKMWLIEDVFQINFILLDNKRAVSVVIIYRKIVPYCTTYGKRDSANKVYNLIGNGQFQ